MSGGRLEGKVALITGGGTGIGRSVAEKFAAAGARVVVAGRRRDPLDAVVRQLGGGRALAVPGDVTLAAARSAMLAAATQAFGGLDVLVGCAGMPSRAPLAEIREHDWHRVLEVNATAPVMLAREALPLLRSRRGSVIHVSRAHR